MTIGGRQQCVLSWPKTLRYWSCSIRRSRTPSSPAPIPIRFGSVGADVTVAASVPEALATFDSAQLDLLVADLAMPDVSGYDLIREIRRRPPERGGLIPAIAISGLATEQDKEEALAAGFEGFLSKPYENQNLREVIAEIVPLIQEQRTRRARSRRSDACAATPNIEKPCDARSSASSSSTHEPRSNGGCVHHVPPREVTVAPAVEQDGFVLRQSCLTARP